MEHEQSILLTCELSIASVWSMTHTLRHGMPKKKPRIPCPVCKALQRPGFGPMYGHMGDMHTGEGICNNFMDHGTCSKGFCNKARAEEAVRTYTDANPPFKKVPLIHYTYEY